MGAKTNPAQPSGKKGTSRVSRIIKAPRQAVYNAFIDPGSLAAWLAPDNMRGEVHTFDAREGGIFRMTLTYLDSKDPPGGKTAKDKDTFQGRFVELVPYEKIVEVIEFESEDPRFAGEMKMIVTFADSGGGTEVTLLFEDIPEGIRPEDNDKGSNQSLKKLAALLE
jgi:uncharacterized protein YndB with AHSA1/START domain